MGQITDPTEILLTAILSMDAYERNPAAPDKQWVGAKLTGALGNATFVSSDYASGTSFGATAWDWNGQTIIAYQGTTGYNTAINAYGVAFGFSSGPQAQEAFDFFQDIANDANPNLDDQYSSAGIVLTGHSSGGGLAGLVGAVYGQQGVLFDSMWFQQAATNAYDYSTTGVPAEGQSLVPDTALREEIYGASTPQPPNFSGIAGYYVEGNGFGFGNAIDPDGHANVFELHESALLVALLWARDNGLSDWQSVGSSLLAALYGDEATKISTALGISGPSVATVPLTMIAYSALGQVSSGGSLPFGSTALSSLFADADTLGQMQSAGDFTGALATIDPQEYGADGTPVFSALPPSPLDSLMEIAAQFAGDQAAAAATSSSLAKGAFNPTNGDLKVNLDPSKWTTTYGSSGQQKIVGVSDLVAGVLHNLLSIDPTTTVGGVDADNVIDKFVATKYPSEIDIAVSSSASLDSSGAATSHGAAKANTILIGQKDSGTITAGDGDNVVFGGQTVTVGNGDNIIVGEASDETITIGGGNNVVIASGADNTINVNADQTNASQPGINYVYAGTGGDTINFNSGDGYAGVVVLPVTNFSVNALLDLNQTALTAAINAQLTADGGEAWGTFERYDTSGMKDYDWTVFLEPAGSAPQETIDVNGGPVTKSFLGTGNPVPLQGGSWNPWPGDSLPNEGLIGTFYGGGFSLWCETPAPFPLSLTDYLTQNGAGSNSGGSNSGGSNSGGGGGQSSGGGAPPSANVGDFESNQSGLDSNPAGFSISDTAANVSSAIDALNDDGNVKAITLTDGGTPTLILTAAQALTDTQALGEITNANYEIAVSDTAANVSENFDALNADAKIASITLTDAGTPTLTLTAGEALGDTRALGEITNSLYKIAISDTAADVSENIDALNADGAISSIALTDSGTPTLDLTIAQAFGDARALGEITNAGFAILIHDDVANVLANASKLSGDAQIVGVDVADTAANVLSNLSALRGDAQIGSIAVVDTASAILADAAALAAATGISSLTVVDTAANILANSAALAADSAISGEVVADSAANVAAETIPAAACSINVRS
jgi:hypothetical protein